MDLRFQLERIAQRGADVVYMLLPRPRPSPAALAACRIVSHRGEHDNRRVRENTLAAFDAAVGAGVWGIEFDLRWTRDYIPVVIHDPGTGRVFGTDLPIAETGFAELRDRLPEVPTLVEMVARYGGNTHMMIELKRDPLPDIERKRACLEPILADLVPGRDFHVLALELVLFAPVDFLGDEACMPVAELNYRALSRHTLTRSFAGISGQYVLLGRHLLALHHDAGQKVGTGFVTSRFCFYRELNRGVDWIFSNRAARLCRIRRTLLDAARSSSAGDNG